MDQAKTHTNTPPADAIALKTDPTTGGVPQLRESSSSSTPSNSSNLIATSRSTSKSDSSSPGASSNGSGAGSLKQPNPRKHVVNYVQDIRTFDTHGYVTPSQQQLGQEDASHKHGHTCHEHHGEQNSSFNTTIAYDSTAIFKPFDIKTGRFISSSASAASTVTQSENNPEVVMSLTSSAAATRGHHHLHSVDSEAAVHKKPFKFRSQSLPTIMHSSFRKLNSQVMVSSTNESSTIQTYLTSLSSANKQSIHSSKHALGNLLSSSQVSGIKKKKHWSKNNHYSLCNAILMSHKLQFMNNQEFSIEERIHYFTSYSGPIPLPPINLQCLREIDLSEIVKNPQLRHDIVFDPLLQFRPNLDGERGLKKRQISDKYWADVENEILVYNQRPDVFNYEKTRLVPLFDTLKDLLITIVPQKEISSVENVLDTELLIQELLRESLIMTNLSDWLAQLFKHHCAPMRDPWVDSMQKKFREAQNERSVTKLVEALKLVFQILEAMKLDIANHQIRILRPALLSNAVEFEKQYFQSMMNLRRVNLTSSLKWFKNKYGENLKSDTFNAKKKLGIPEVYRLCIRSIISLLSCRKMVGEYPTSLSFDHARLILLRADIRQVVCLLVCKLLFKQLVANDASVDRATKKYIMLNYSNRRLEEEIVSIITDEHGNYRWTKNTMSIAVHLCNTINELKQDYETFREQNTRQLGLSRTAANAQTTNFQRRTTTASSLTRTMTSLDSKVIEFAKSWLSKQTQPLSEVYGVLENRVFKSLEESIFQRSNCSKDGIIKQDFIDLCNSSSQGLSKTSKSNTTKSIFNTLSKSLRKSPNSPANSHNSIFTNVSENGNNMAILDLEEFESLYHHLYIVVNFHWSVFGCHYIDSLGDLVE